MIKEIFKSKTEEERRRNVTEVVVKLENDLNQRNEMLPLNWSQDTHSVLVAS